MLERFIAIGEGKRISLALGRFKGVDRLDIRFQFWGGTIWRSTMRGVVVPIDQLDNLIGALHELRDAQRSLAP